MTVKYTIRKGKDDIKTFQYRYRVNGKQTTKSFKAKNTTKTTEKAAIKELENYYGVVLFERLSRKLYITSLVFSHKENLPISVFANGIQSSIGL